jgi:histidinol-phosphate aminotransferase
MTKSIRELVPSFIRDIDPYVPGKPIEEVERELHMRAVKLASNENPLGPSPLAIEAAAKALAESNRYPDGSGFYLREKLAGRLGVPSENVILANGSTELIDLTARSVLHENEMGITSQGSFPMYTISIRAAGANLVETPLKDFTFDLGAILSAITPPTKLIYIANPNNPTGTMVTADEFEGFLSRVPDGVMVVLDEAYFEYVELPNYSGSIELVRRWENLLMVRTF